MPTARSWMPGGGQQLPGRLGKRFLAARSGLRHTGGGILPCPSRRAAGLPRRGEGPPAWPFVGGVSLLSFRRSGLLPTCGPGHILCPGGGGPRGGPVQVPAYQTQDKLGRRSLPWPLKASSQRVAGQAPNISSACSVHPRQRSGPGTGSQARRGRVPLVRLGPPRPPLEPGEGGCASPVHPGRGVGVTPPSSDTHRSRPSGGAVSTALSAGPEFESCFPAVRPWTVLQNRGTVVPPAGVVMKPRHVTV